MKDLTGEKFGKLTVLKYVEKKGKKHMWLCKCDCGNESIVSDVNLISGNTKSCGCLRRKMIKDKTVDISGKRFGFLTVIKRHHSDNGVHWLCRCDCGNECVVRGRSLRSGHTRSCGCNNGKTPQERKILYHFYHVWWNIVQRCTNKNSISFYNYGGRGIEISEEWKNYQTFKKDMFAKYKIGLQIDRIDNNKGYEKNNCRWVTPKENARNRRNNTWVTINGVRKLATEWSRNNVASFMRRHRYDENVLIEGGKYDNTKLKKRHIELEG